MESLILSLLTAVLAMMVSPIIFRKTKIPLVVIEILFGILLGKSFFNLITPDPVIDFLVSFGLIYLMFLSGLEVNPNLMKTYLSKILSISSFSLFVPFLSGILLSSYIGINPLFLGTILSTTSLGVILPLVKEFKGRKQFSQILFGSVVLIDISSIFLLTFVLTYIQGYSALFLFYSFLFILVLFLIPWMLKKGKISKKIESWLCTKAHFEQGVRFSFALIVVFVAIVSEVGFHSIIGAFIAGLIISELLTHERSLLKKKIEGFGYGFFIPLFFIFVGAKVDLPAILFSINNLWILLVILSVGILSKIFGVGIGSKLSGFDRRRNIAFGLFHTARLSLIIAGIEIGLSLGLINETVYSMFVILSMVSVLLGPSLGKYLLLKT